jgi:dinuclear metal center YbgI/SA1388 family protein
MKLKIIIDELELLAPPSLQESYDNSGLLTGNHEMEITGILVCLDSIESILDEAISKKCNLIVAHHPILFSGIKRLTGKNYIERVIIKAIKNDIAIYSIHTNLDNVKLGVNAMMAQKIGLVDIKILAPLSGKLKKLVTFVPNEHAEAIKTALFSAGAGKIGNYDECSFNVKGTGTFKALEGAKPYVGEAHFRHNEEETRIEVIFENWKEHEIVKKLKSNHPYEEVAYYIQSLDNSHAEIGAGCFGTLPSEMEINYFLNVLKVNFNAQGIRYTNPNKKTVKQVALCGGSGSFLLNDAIKSGADVFVSADFKYHQFFDAEGEITIIDIGHFETEQFTIELVGNYLREKFINFAVHFTEINTNPINYI